MTDDQRVQTEFLALKQKFTTLALERRPPNYLIIGTLYFSTNHNGETCKDGFDLEVSIPASYPDKLPTVIETGNRIPESFHHNPDKTLCLGAPLEIRMAYTEKPSLTGFFEKCVVPYLFSFCVWKKTGEMPLGELPHGGEGIFKFYSRHLEINDALIALAFLKILSDDNYRGHLTCPCGSRQKLRKCHGDKLLHIKQFQAPEDFEYDYRQIVSYAHGKKIFIPEAFRTKKLTKDILTF